MRLSATQTQAVIRFLATFTPAKCPVCGHDDWSISDTLFALPEYESPFPGQGFTRLGAPPPPPSLIGSGQGALAGLAALTKPAPQVFPVLPVTCATCGYVFLMSGKKLGLA